MKNSICLFVISIFALCNSAWAYYAPVITLPAPLLSMQENLSREYTRTNVNLGALELSKEAAWAKMARGVDGRIATLGREDSFLRLINSFAFPGSVNGSAFRFVDVTPAAQGSEITPDTTVKVDAGAKADTDNLVVTQDESSMERIIEANLKAVHKLTVTEKFATEDANDLYLQVPMKGDPMPAYHFTIDTQVANRDDTTHLITERAVLVELNTTIKVTAEHRAAVLEILNNLNRGKIFASVYIDTDGEIIFGWNLNVMSQGLPVEYVYDVVAREDKIWRGVYAELQQAMQ